MSNAWKPDVFIDSVAYQPGFAAGPIGVSALFRKLHKAAVAQSRHFDLSVETTDTNYSYLKSRQNAFEGLQEIAAQCGIAPKALLQAEREKIKASAKSTEKHSVDIVFSTFTTWTDNPTNPLTFTLLPEARNLAETNQDGFQENYGYYYVSLQSRRSHVSVVYHIEASSDSTAAWEAMTASLNVQRDDWTASDLNITVGNIKDLANAGSDMTISMRIICSGISGIGTEHTFGTKSTKNDITKEFSRIWDDAKSKSKLGAQPHTAQLTSYRSTFTDIAWSPRYAGISVYTEGQIRRLESALQELEKALAALPFAEPSRPKRKLLLSFAEGQSRYHGIQQAIISAPNPIPPLIEHEIESALQHCAKLSDDISDWQARYTFLLGVISERRGENRFTGLRGYVPCDSGHKWGFGQPPPAGCPFHYGTPIEVDRTVGLRKVTRELQVSEDSSEIVLSYSITALKDGDNGYWRTNKPILASGQDCSFHFDHRPGRKIKFQVTYRLGLRADYDFPELLDPIRDEELRSKK